MRRHADLAWFFGGDMEAALGLRSNFAPLVDLAMSGLGGGGSRPAAEVSDRRIDDATRARRIRAVLEQLTPGTVHVLWALHAPHAWPREVRAELGELAALVLLSPLAREAIAEQEADRRGRVKSGPDWLLSLCVKGGPALEELRVGARKGAEQALRDYELAAGADAPPASRRRRRAADDDVEPILPSAAWRR